MSNKTDIFSFCFVFRINAFIVISKNISIPNSDESLILFTKILFLFLSFIWYFTCRTKLLSFRVNFFFTNIFGANNFSLSRNIKIDDGMICVALPLDKQIFQKKMFQIFQIFILLLENAHNFIKTNLSTQETSKYNKSK